MSHLNHQLHIFVFPAPGQGHMIPLVDLAKLFAIRDVKTTIIDTDLMSVPISSTIKNVDIITIKLPSVEAGFPEGFSLNNLESRPDLLQQPLEQLLEKHHPDCLVSDISFPWTTEAAAKFGIPRIVFHGTGFFPCCASESIRLYEPHKKVSSDTEPFLIPHFPGEIELTRKLLPDYLKQETDFTKFFIELMESELRSFGVIVNSFYELEPAYADQYRKVLGRKAWHIGPVSLQNTVIDEKLERGKKADIDKHECLKWLDSKEPNSVVYICFGSNCNFTDSQLLELATGLEAAGKQFIWAVNKQKSGEQGKEEWLPEGFEARMEGKGMIIRGWAPQVLILDHEAVGGFVTHCGWNSLLEGVCAGVTMVTWPFGGEQFYNEKLVTQVLGIGVAVGVNAWGSGVGDVVKRESITNAVREIMVGDRVEEMRSRALALRQAAFKAVENGGSSYSDMAVFIEELSLRN